MRKWSKSVIDILSGAVRARKPRCTLAENIFHGRDRFVDALNRLKGEHMARKTRNKRENAIN